VWDGLDKNGLPVANKVDYGEGKYYVIVSAETTAGQPAVKARADFDLTLTVSSDTPAIENFEPSNDFFAPNADGRHDDVGITANFTKDVD